MHSGNLIIGDSKTTSIIAYNLENEEKRILVSGISHVRSIHFDDFGNNIYWCDWGTITIEALSLNTLVKTIILSGTSYETPIELALAPEEGFVDLYSIIFE